METRFPMFGFWGLVAGGGPGLIRSASVIRPSCNIFCSTACFTSRMADLYSRGVISKAALFLPSSFV